ncbi:NAD-dependent epimerase/dehydratase family protein [Streptomyces sp. CA-111067]|uniref:NAD-dependent epimerase/dehydratase family protein n=1 Tax=Streptomyces sp. CA-111067 TaxID=3240046 RepID=UPI003D96DD8E
MVGGDGVTARRIVVTGATGFVGSQVVRRLLCRPVEVRAVAHRSAHPAVEHATGGGRVSWSRASVAEPATLRGLFDGADAVVHLAGYVGRDEARCEAVNARGGRAVAELAHRSGVPKLLYVSTTAVYGPGPHRGIDVDEVRPAPVSAASRTRLAAESAFLAVGGTVLRPALVLGADDRWVVPALAELVRRVPTGWDGGHALLSVTASTDLARLVAELACAPGRGPGGVHHAAHPEPVRSGDLLRELTGHGLLPAVSGDLPWDQCLARLRAVPGEMTERQFALLARDHWYRSDRIWQIASCRPGPGPLRRLADAADWYRTHLAERGMPAA